MAFLGNTLGADGADGREGIQSTCWEMLAQEGFKGDQNSQKQSWPVAQ